MLHDTGKIEDVNYSIYLKWFDSFIEDCRVEQIVYVKADPNLCQERIAKRSRAGESGIPLAYLEECHKYHEAMLDPSSAECVCLDQLVVNGNVDIYENEVHLQDMVQQVLSFIQVDESTVPSKELSLPPLRLESLPAFQAH